MGSRTRWIIGTILIVLSLAYTFCANLGLVPWPFLGAVPAIIAVWMVMAPPNPNCNSAICLHPSTPAGPHITRHGLKRP